MRSLRLFALALVLSPSLALAQAVVVDSSCSATAVGPENAGNRPTCGISRNTRATITSFLRLGLVTGALIDLQASDSTIAYEKTRTAAGGPGTTGLAVGAPVSLQDASARDSLIVQANRPYLLTIAATTTAFKFDKDAGYNVCRDTPSSTTLCAATGNTVIAKPIGDLYWGAGAAPSFAQIGGPLAPATIRNRAAGGERYATGIAFKSAWFYDTDIPGVYTATVRYTVTGQ